MTQVVCGIKLSVHSAYVALSAPTPPRSRRSMRSSKASSRGSVVSSSGTTPGGSVSSSTNSTPPCRSRSPTTTPRSSMASTWPPPSIGSSRRGAATRLPWRGSRWWSGHGHPARRRRETLPRTPRPSNAPKLNAGGRRRRRVVGSGLPPALDAGDDDFRIWPRRYTARSRRLPTPRWPCWDFAWRWVASNLLAAVRAALRCQHGPEAVETRVSNYHPTQEVAAT